MKNLQLIAEDVIPRVRGKQPARPRRRGLHHHSYGWSEGAWRHKQ